MSSRSRPLEEPGLFDELDLPLRRDVSQESIPAAPGRAREVNPPTESRTEHPEPQPLPLFSEEAEKEPVEEVTRPAWRPIVPFSAYLTAGLIDLSAVLGVMLMTWAGLWFLGIELDVVGRLFVLFFLVPFSFLYQTFPLAFWGCTPGMARAGTVARSRDGQTLSFSQAALRWMASLLTVALAGLPLILTATKGQSLADYLSGSQTLPAR